MVVADNYIQVDLEQIKALITIRDILLEEGIELKNGRSRCPIHRGENRTSFSFNDETYYCFSCGAKGNVVTLVQELHGFSFKDALRHLAKKTGISVETSERSRVLESRTNTPFDWGRYFEEQEDRAILFLEKVWTTLLRKLEDELRKGQIDLARYYRDRQWLEYCLNDLDDFSIARNWKKNQMRKEINEKKGDGRGRKAGNWDAL